MALTPTTIAEEAVRFGAPIVFGPLAWLDFGRVGLSKETIDAVVSAQKPQPPGPNWQPTPPKPDYTLLWVLGAIALTGVAIAVLRK